MGKESFDGQIDGYQEDSRVKMRVERNCTEGCLGE